MRKVQILNSMYEGINDAATRSDANADEDITKIMEEKKALKQLRRTFALRTRQKALYARMIVFYKRKLRRKFKQRNKLNKKIEKCNISFKKLLLEEKNKRKLVLEKQRRHVQYLKEMSAVRTSVIKVYKREKKKYQRNARAPKHLLIEKNKALKKIKAQIMKNTEKYEDVKEDIIHLKKKIKLSRERIKSISVKDLKRKIKATKLKLETAKSGDVVKEDIIYELFPDTKMTGFQKRSIVGSVLSPMMGPGKIPRKSKSQTEKIPKQTRRRVKKRVARTFSTDTSISKTSAMKDGTIQSEHLSIGDKLRDKPKRLANRFTRRLADRKKRSKRSSSPPGDYKTTTTVSADSDDTGMELKAKKKQLQLKILDEKQNTLQRDSVKSLSDQQQKKIQEELPSTIGEEDSEKERWRKTVNAEDFFRKLVRRHSSKIITQLQEQRRKERVEFERKKLQEEEEQRKAALELARKNDKKRSSSIISNELNQQMIKALKSTYKEDNFVPSNIAIIDEDILELAGKTKRKTMIELIPSKHRGTAQTHMLGDLDKIRSFVPVVDRGKVKKRTKLFKRKGAKKPIKKVEEKVSEKKVSKEKVEKEKISKEIASKEISPKGIAAIEITSKEKVPKEVISKEIVSKEEIPKKRLPSVSILTPEDAMFDDTSTMYDEYDDDDESNMRKLKKSLRSHGKVEGLASLNNSMYHKFLAEQKRQSQEQRRSSIGSVGSIRSGKLGSTKRHTSESIGGLPEIRTQQKELVETIPLIQLPKKRKPRGRAKEKTRESLEKEISRISQALPLEGEPQKRRSRAKIKQKTRESLEKEISTIARKGADEIYKKQDEAVLLEGEPQKRRSRAKIKRKTRESLEKEISTIARKDADEIHKKENEAVPLKAEPQKRISRAKSKGKPKESLQIKSSKKKSKSLHDIRSKSVNNLNGHIDKKVLRTYSTPKMQDKRKTEQSRVQFDSVKEELTSTMEQQTADAQKHETVYDANYYQRLVRAHDAAIKLRLQLERRKKLELEEKLLKEKEEEEKRKALELANTKAKARTSSYDTKNLNKQVEMALASNYKLSDVIPQDIPVIDDNILKLASRTRRMTMKNALEGIGKPSDNSGHTDLIPKVGRVPSNIIVGRRSTFSKRRTSRKSTTKIVKLDEELEKMTDNTKYQTGSMSAYGDISYDDVDVSTNTRDTTKFIRGFRRVEGLAYGNNSMYHRYLAEYKRQLLEEKQASIANEVKTPQEQESKRESKRRQSRRSIMQRTKKSIVMTPSTRTTIQTTPIFWEDITQPESEIRPSLHEEFRNQLSPTEIKSKIIETKDQEKSKSTPDICRKSTEADVRVVCSACGMTNLTPGGPCCPLKPKTE